MLHLLRKILICKDHVHFKDETAINKDGTIHDEGHGIPNLNKKLLDWLNINGWCLNGVKY
jgi:hypothetical protein